MAAIDGKQIVNVLTVGYAEIARKLLSRPPPKVVSTWGMCDLSLDILLTMATRDMLIKQGIIPADIMKQQHLRCKHMCPKNKNTKR